MSKWSETTRNTHCLRIHVCCENAYMCNETQRDEQWARRRRRRRRRKRERERDEEREREREREREKLRLKAREVKKEVKESVWERKSVLGVVSFIPDSPKWQLMTHNPSSSEAYTHWHQHNTELLLDHHSHHEPRLHSTLSCGASQTYVYFSFQ